MNLGLARADEGLETTPARERPVRVGFIVGPTGVGKTAVALEVAAALEAEIVNCDSRQVYRGMNIGTAKPSLAQRLRIPHHLIDVRSPEAPLDVAEFARLARAAIAEVAARGRRVLIVGGSGLYLRVLRCGIFQGPRASREIRAELHASAECRGIAHLHECLREIDPFAAARINPCDLRRIVRAIEVFRLTGTPISEHQRRHRFAAHEYESLTVGLTLSRELLYQAINCRFDAMLEAGLIEEVRALVDAGYRVDMPPLCTIGYREIGSYLCGEIELDQAIEGAKRESRRLAKRQLTWFRAEPDVIWIDPRDGVSEAVRLLGDFFAH